MAVVAWTSTFLALMAEAGRTQEPGLSSDPPDPPAFARGADFALEETPRSLPRSLSAEEGPRDPGESEFSIGPAAGYIKARGSDRGTWMAGVQMRLHFLKVLAAEASITYHEDEFENGTIVVTQYPVQVTGLLFPFPDWEFKPYVLAGAGWYTTRVRYHGLASLLSQDRTDHSFGGHFGAGAEVRLGPSASLDADVRYIFLDPGMDNLKRRDFDSWEFTAGLNVFF